MSPAPAQPFALRFASNRSPVLGTRGMVAASQPLAAAAGVAVLQRGGNAADAAVATAAALGVTEPCNTGLGGDCFALFYEARSGAVTAMNSSGRAAAALDIERVAADGFADGLPPFHAHTVTVPGACEGWCELVARHGRLGLGEVLEPAIALADGGFPVAPTAAYIWNLGVERQLATNSGGAELLIDGRAPRAGELFRNPGLARSLQAIAETGRSAYYEGAIAEAIVAVVRAHGGVMAAEDLALHRATWERPISTVYSDLRVWECPPNGQGLAALLALNVLRGFDVAALDPLGPERLHLMIEAMRLAFADARWYVSDPAVHQIPLEELLSETYAAERRRLIDPARANTRARRGTPVAGSDTVQFCVVDGEGNACSFINSNYMGFGTGLVPPGCGFALQNRGFGFSLDPDHPNALAPGKRPYHTIIPGLLTREADGSLYGPFGVMGGFNQPQAHMQVVVAMADDGCDPQAALDRPRFQIQSGTAGGEVGVEAGIPEAALAALAERGHVLHPADGWGRLQFGRGQIIRREPDGVLWGGSDPRADGCALTY